MKRSIKYFVQNKIVKGTSYYLRNEQINPPFSVIYFKG